MNYNIISEHKGIYTVELVHKGITYRSSEISDADFVSLDNATDEDIWKLLTPLHFFSVDFLKLFGFIK